MKVNGYGIALGQHHDVVMRDICDIARTYMAGHLVPQCTRRVVSVKKTRDAYLTPLLAERSDHHETVRGHLLHQLRRSRAASARAASLRRHATSRPARMRESPTRSNSTSWEARPRPPEPVWQEHPVAVPFVAVPTPPV